MISTSKRHKYLEEEGGRTIEDRISSLPSSILGDILSLLPTKDAVATSVLSTTWKEMWTLVTRLYFSDDLSQSPYPINWFSTDEYLHAEFVNFVNRVLMLGRFSCITSFFLCCKKSYDPLFVNASLACVLKCNNVQELVMWVPLKNSIALPSNLFTCRTLVKLRMGEKISMNVPCRVYLPCLKDVELVEVRFAGDDAITRFFGGCPVLDTLRMKKCLRKKVKVMRILIPSLTSLVIEHMRVDEDYVIDDYMYRYDHTFRIVLDTPQLSHIFIRDCVPEACVVTSPLQKLRTARLDICGPLASTMKSLLPIRDIHRAAMSDLLMGVSKVEAKLFICCEDIGRCLLPTFENLRELAFDDWKNLTLDMMIKLLESTPRLHLFMPILTEDKEDEEDSGNTSCEFGPPEKIPNCLLSHLKTIHIKEFAESSKNVEIVKYFLKNARVMEKLIIQCRVNNTVAAEFIVNLPRASSSMCKIEIL